MWDTVESDKFPVMNSGCFKRNTSDIKKIKGETLLHWEHSVKVSGYPRRNF